MKNNIFLKKRDNVAYWKLMSGQRDKLLKYGTFLYNTRRLTLIYTCCSAEAIKCITNTY